MNIEDFLELNKVIIENELKQLGLNYTFEQIKKLLLDEIESLSEVIVSSELTRDKVSLILNTYKNKRLLHTPKSRFVRRWLIMFCKIQKAFNYAYVHLQIDANRDPENYPVINIETFGDSEIKNAIHDYKLKTNSKDNNTKIITNNYPDGIPAREKFNSFPETDFPTIDDEIIDPQWIWEKYHNRAFECSIDAFYAWLVYGKEYKPEQISWIFKKSNKDVISKAQLKMFINLITGNETETKKAFFNHIFNIEVNKSDYKNSSLDPSFKELATKIERKRLGIK